MKSKTLPLMAALIGPIAALLGPVGAEPVREDLTNVYEAGRTAFNKGDLAAAKTAFTKVLKAKPDFDLAIIYMAQIRHAEEKWAARPRSQKISETAVIEGLELRQVTLADALEVVRREVEKAGRGPTAGTIALLTDLPAEVLERPVTLSVKQQPMPAFVEAVAFAGGVRISWHERGISVTSPEAAPARPGPAQEAAIRRMKEIAKTKVIPHLRMENVSAVEAWERLRQEARSSGPMIVVREPVTTATVNLDLRQIPLSEAIRSVALVTGMEVTWQPWGAGAYPKTAVAVNAPTEARQDASGGQ